MAAKEADDCCAGDGAECSRDKKNEQEWGDWMGNLPVHLQDIPLHTLYIPGTHNSGSYLLRKDWEVAPDADLLVKSLCNLPMAKDIIYRWSLCQNLSVRQQLEAGVRYLDLRVAVRSKTGELHLVHALYGPTVATCMEELKTFLEEHTNEVVLLDFNHFHSMELEHHLQLITYLMFVFNGMLCPHSSPEALTLKSLQEKGTRVVVFYDHDCVTEFPDLWPQSSIRSMWSNTMNVEKCLSHQEEAAKERCGDVFYVCQAVLTPTPAHVLQKFNSSLHAECAKKINSKMPQRLNCDGLKGCKGMVCIADFVEEDGFIENVVDLNK